ncbi:hypothetical protein SDC9_212853 [bioreactor metagenome]|uniref:Uncharacterized protein n=1 Tax=bioreactor metagenome TaxID=1076179 RepID=A0A645K0I1_9ZZZZ
MPDGEKGAMDRQEEAGYAGREAFPHRVHHPERAQCTGAAESVQALRSALHRLGRDGEGAHNRPEVPRRLGRVHVHPAQLGQQHELPSAHPHGGHRRRHHTRRSVEADQGQILPSGESALQPVQGQIPLRLQGPV